MKKLIGMISLAALAGCGGAAEEKAKAPAVATALEAGQWRSSLEVTQFRQADTGAPKLNMPVGTRAEAEACITAAEATRPPPQLFAGSDFDNCVWADDFYMRGGRLISGLTCNRRGVGEVLLTVNVNFTGQSYEGTTEMMTRLASDGDVVLTARAQGRRTGPHCTTAADGAGNAQSATK